MYAILVFLMVASPFFETEATSCLCGQEKTVSRVIGGSGVHPNRYPWMVYVNDKGFLCGGSLINNQYVLTAAHCIHGGVPRVVLGAHTKAERKTFPAEPIDKVIVHPNFTGEVGSQGDIALIKLARPVLFTGKVAPICLPSSGQPEARNLFVTGWGVTDVVTDEVGEQLNEVALDPLDTRTCHKHVPEMNPKQQLCAGDRDRAVCSGDSGGPLSTRKEGRVYQIGVASYVLNQDCGHEKDEPAIFTRVSGFIEWINDNTRDATYCS